MAVCLSGLPAPKEFDTVGEPATLQQRWTIWHSEFELFCAASGIKDAKQQRALLLHLAGTGIREIFRSIPDEKKGEDKEYKKAMDALTEHFQLKKNVPQARQTFLTTKPKPGERINNFVTRLQTLADHCDYNDEKDNQIRDHTLTFVTDKQLKAKLYRDNDLTLSKLLEIVSSYHDKEALVLTPANPVNRIHHTPRAPPPKFQGRCHKCNKVGHFARDCRCSQGHKCTKCGKLGHYEICCKSKPAKGNDTKPGHQHDPNKKPTHHVNTVEPSTTTFNQTPDDDDYYAFTAADSLESPSTIPVLIEDKPIDIVVDSGASCDLISHEVFQSMFGGIVPVTPCSKQVFPYLATKALDLVGSCTLNVGVPQTNANKCTEFCIVPGRAATLLGRELSESLGILKVGVPVNSCNINITPWADKKAVLRAKYPRVFQGLGKLKGFQLKLHINPNIKPLAQPIRRIPFSRRQKVNEKLGELEKLGVIEKVNTPTSWINPLVAVEKPNGDVRICLDMRQANQAIQREKHPVPTVEETLQEISSAKLFTKLDLNMAFHQIELDPDSRDITTFAAPNGLYRYTRLLFGVNMATEKFQNLIWQVLKDCPGTHNLHDDILVVGKDEREHDRNLEKTLQKLEECGLTLNYDKCLIGVNSMSYMGEILSSDGLQLSKERVKAIAEAPDPKNQFEVRSFLGSVQFCAKFIPQFATISAPLWDLTSKNAKWKWGSKEAAAFSQIKHLLTCAPVMAYYNQNAKTRITTDASPVGLGAIIEQEQPDGHFRPVYYASRKLSKTEQRYSQFEREALAVKWACEKFFLFLYGTEFEIRTDHKPLITVLGPNSKPPSARIERWLLYLQRFRYKVTHIQGKYNSADVLSRLPVGPTESNDPAATKVYACSVASQAVPSALTAKEVELASERDPTLKLIRDAVASGDWTHLSGTMYKAISDEIWVLGQIVMRGNRIIMPGSLWKQTLSLAHEGHQGIVRTKSRLREKVWWPNMNKQVEQLVKACYQCQLVGPRPKPEPIRSTKLPDGPWSNIAVDLLDIPAGNHLLVVIDIFSRWPEAVLVKKTDAQHIITAMEGIFRTHGLPQSIRSDNGPPFASKEFESFLKHLGIEHQKGIPYWPQSNGEVERCNQTILKAIRIANLEGTNWRTALENFLFQYRTTPHSTTGLSPAKLLMGRTLRDKLPKLTIPEDRATEAEWQQLLRERDALNKLRQKEYADTRRSAEHSIIEEGDEILLKQTRENKLDTNFEPAPYKVIQKDGNALLLENKEGVRKMRNVAHVKKLVKQSTDSDPAETMAPINSTLPVSTSQTPAEPRPVREKTVPSRYEDYILV